MAYARHGSSAPLTQILRNLWENPQAALIYDRLHPAGDDTPLFVELASEFGGPVLEVGCGTGRCLIPLIRAGFDTLGLDRSEAMLGIMREKLKGEQDEIAHRASLIHGDGLTFAIPLRFGMAFTGKDSYCHFLSREEQEMFVSNVFHHLRPGGILVIDVFNPEPERLLSPKELKFADGEVKVRDRVIAQDFAEQLLTMETVVSMGDQDPIRIQWPMRYTYRFELELLVEKAGFEIASVWQDHQRRPFENGAKRIIIVGRKPHEADLPAVHFMRTVVEEPVA